MNKKQLIYANNLKETGKSWHFHILSPDCKLNKSNNFVLVIENGSDGESQEYESQDKPLTVGKDLVNLLHGDGITSTNEGDSKPSTGVAEILARAQKLTKNGKFWHHHMLFPDCKYNDSGKWLIMFEDQASDEVLKCVYASEPGSDLRHIEKLFYQQS